MKSKKYYLIAGELISPTDVFKKITSDYLEWKQLAKSETIISTVHVYSNTFHHIS